MLYPWVNASAWVINKINNPCYVAFKKPKIDSFTSATPSPREMVLHPSGPLRPAGSHDLHYDIEYDIKSIVIKLCLPVSRRKTDKREGILDEIDPGVSKHVKIVLIVQSTEAQNGDEKTLNHIILKIGIHVREGLLMYILKVPGPGGAGSSRHRIGFRPLLQFFLNISKNLQFSNYN
ncbi:hypothetical protein AVEN_76238-1 [Araneus ventricosus]|uniref:Uncharacterized protein n=1 Tax=Araneus ventricosus TaxID=182803 RepID=A0A4Y2W9Y6_ARAVE|nr:hypothetical protein AVEN_76238-1 [Araneus ventricosus]